MLLCDVELLFEMTMKHLPQGAFSLLTTLSVLTGLWG